RSLRLVRSQHIRRYAHDMYSTTNTQQHIILRLLKEFWNVHAVELSLQILEQKREVKNYRVAVQLIRRIGTVIETLDEGRDRCDDRVLRGRFIKRAVFAERLAEQSIHKAGMPCLDGRN